MVTHTITAAVVVVVEGMTVLLVFVNWRATVIPPKLCHKTEKQTIPLMNSYELWLFV